MVELSAAPSPFSSPLFTDIEGLTRVEHRFVCGPTSGRPQAGVCGAPRRVSLNASGRFAPHWFDSAPFLRRAIRHQIEALSSENVVILAT